MQGNNFILRVVSCFFVPLQRSICVLSCGVCYGFAVANVCVTLLLLRALIYSIYSHFLFIVNDLCLIAIIQYCRWTYRRSVIQFYFRVIYIFVTSYFDSLIKRFVIQYFEIRFTSCLKQTLLTYAFYDLQMQALALP